MISKIRMGVVGAAALGTAAFVIPAGGAQALSAAPQTKTVSVQAQDAGTRAAAATCWTRVIRVNGGNLKYRECDSGNYRKVTGVLNDTKTNGRCVWAKIRFVPTGGTKTYKDCGGATTKFSTGWKRAADARVTLS
ncbi:hypothetical protein RCO28_32695 [Streptomyces sp. LHD-70]|uniref:hypothetical protein n=1 Tax=Streptomyces sp. LHD-70 TaxID=3072140 RepID=UPI002810850D|nr:hypothetical protein [Streptomyces sp. LHD-70]MDQ8707190.1 hypothetical protein [Streptomyces sp. LHD-70]